MRGPAVTSPPETLTFQGRLFRRSSWTKPYTGLDGQPVVAQYRENVPTDSAHLFMFADGTVVVPHVDRWNPDRSFTNCVLHLFVEDTGHAARLCLALAAGFALARWGRSP